MGERLAKASNFLPRHREVVPSQVRSFSGRIALAGADVVYGQNVDQNIKIQAAVLERSFDMDSDESVALVRPIIPVGAEGTTCATVRNSELLAEQLDHHGITVVYDAEPARLETQAPTILNPYRAISESIAHLRSAPETSQYSGDQLVVAVVNPVMAERSFSKIELQHLAHGGVAELTGSSLTGSGVWEPRA